jgi:hypothetical protein
LKRSRVRLVGKLCTLGSDNDTLRSCIEMLCPCKGSRCSGHFNLRYKAVFENSIKIVFLLLLTGDVWFHLCFVCRTRPMHAENCRTRASQLPTARCLPRPLDAPPSCLPACLPPCAWLSPWADRSREIFPQAYLWLRRACRCPLRSTHRMIEPKPREIPQLLAARGFSCSATRPLRMQQSFLWCSRSARSGLMA